MSVTTKQRFIMNQLTRQYFLPEPNEMVGRVIKCCASNLVMVEDQKGEQYLASIPSKFRKLIYMKRGTFVFLIPISEGVKVKAEITQILDSDNVLYVRERNLLPERFDEFAKTMTRQARRGVETTGTKKHDTIDEDMLPPSDSDGSDEELEEESDENDEIEPEKNGQIESQKNRQIVEDNEDVDGEESSEDEQVMKTYNPNHSRRL